MTVTAETEAKPKKKRPGAVDTLVAKDKTAVFWFLAAIVTAAACAWYVDRMSTAFGLKTPFVVMDTSGAFYVPPGLPYGSPLLDEMHLHMASMAVETLLVRNREGLVHQKRLPKLFMKPAQIVVNKWLEKEAGYFRSQEVTQDFEITSRSITGRATTAVGTWVKGTVRRSYFLRGKEQEVTYAFDILIAWRQNKDTLRTGNFPSMVEKIDIADFKPISSTLPESEPDGTKAKQ
ncbi:MAG: hypothetical protein LDL31_04090 [Prosthecobacter sp.]|nr:hypothetical protein [Prosthecobacter sp.]